MDRKDDDGQDDEKAIGRGAERLMLAKAMKNRAIPKRELLRKALKNRAILMIELLREIQRIKK